jgi:hypothetical protein
MSHYDYVMAVPMTHIVVMTSSREVLGSDISFFRQLNWALPAAEFPRTRLSHQYVAYSKAIGHSWVHHFN